MAKKIFHTVEDAEAAFYDALEHCDLAAMMTVWSADEHTVLIHPNGPRICGLERIRNNWAEMFALGASIKVAVTELRKHQSPTMAIHNVYETYSVPNVSQTIPPILATNAYTLTPAGWRMILHHGSVAPIGTVAAEQGLSRIVH